MVSSLDKSPSDIQNGLNGRCALGVIMSYYGWSGRDDSQHFHFIIIIVTTSNISR
jgi:hypothetical protein